MSRPFDVLVKAYKDKAIVHVFDLPLDANNVLKVKLEAPDWYSIIEEQEKLYQTKLAECVSDGMGEHPANLDSWNKEVSTLSEEAQAAMQSRKPSNLAEQVAQRLSRLRTVQKLVPMFIKDAKSGELLCPSKNEQRQFEAIIVSSPPLIKVLSDAWASLSAKINAVQEEVKNFSGEAKPVNSSSEIESPKGTEDIEDLSIPS